MSYLHLSVVSSHGDEPTPVLLATVFTLLLALFTQTRPNRTRLINIFSLHTACIGLWVFGVYQMTVARGPMEGYFWARFANVAALIIPATFFHLILLLTGPDVPLRKLPWARLGYFLSVCVLLASPTRYFIKGTVHAPGYYYYPAVGPLFYVLMAIFGLYISWGHVRLFKSYSQTTGTKRNHIKYVFVGYGIGYLGGSQTFLPGFGVGMVPYAMYGIPLGLGIITYAILAHHLMDITVIIRKTIIYSVVTFSLTAVYLATIGIFTRLFQGLSGYQTVFSSGIAAALITLGFQPLRKRVQTFVDGKFFRQYVDREEKLYELSRDVVTHTTQEAMSAALLRVIEETIHPKVARLYLRKADGTGFVCATGTGDSELLRQMEEVNPLQEYFAGHPQPFVHDVEDDLAESRDTRQVVARGKTAA